MLRDRDIVYFANDWNADHKTSSHHIAAQLKKHNRILYIETGGMRRPRRSGRDFKRIIGRVFLWTKGVRKVDDKFFIYSLIIFPFHGVVARWINKKLNIFILREALKRYKFNEPIFWFVAPHVSYFADYFEKSATVYYCTDNVSQMPGVDQASIEMLEDDLLRKADVVFATAEHLLDRLRQRGRSRNMHYSPHAVDYDHFSQAQNRDLPIADEFAIRHRPIIGYIGLVERWVDLDLIAYIAKARPDWAISLIGRIAIDVDPVSFAENIQCLGVKRYRDLPRYLKGFDVCILPFKINELTKSVNPIKIKEYLASGKPIVATSLPEMKLFNGLVEVAESYDDFVQKIDMLLNSDGRSAKRMSFVRHDSWSNRVEMISQAIECSIRTRS